MAKEDQAVGMPEAAEVSQAQSQDKPVIVVIYQDGSVRIGKHVRVGMLLDAADRIVQLARNIELNL